MVMGKLRGKRTRGRLGRLTPSLEDQCEAGERQDEDEGDGDGYPSNLMNPHDSSLLFVILRHRSTFFLS